MFLKTLQNFKQKPFALIQIVFLLFLVFQLIVFGSSKHAPAKQASEFSRAVTNAVPLQLLEPNQKFLLTQIGTNEIWNFNPPTHALICEKWLKRGASLDLWRFTTNEVYQIPFCDTAFDGLVISSTGVILPRFLGEKSVARARFRDIKVLGSEVSTNAYFFAPLRAPVGIVPVANWQQLPTTNRPCQVWTHVSPSNSLLVTWQNVLLNRQIETPVSFQAEFFEEGSVIYRYDFSRANLWTGSPNTNLLTGVFENGKGARLNVSTLTNVTSLSYFALAPGETIESDLDGDGLTLAQEIYFTKTSPRRSDTDFDGVNDGEEVARGLNPICADSDGDGLVDGSDPEPLRANNLRDEDADGLADVYENYWFGSTNVVHSLTTRDETGWTLDGKMQAGLNPTNGPSDVTISVTNQLAAWKLWDGFVLRAPSSTNLLFERTCPIHRASVRQQFFLSSAPSNAVPWHIENGFVEWEGSDGSRGVCAASPVGDSLRIALTNACVDALTIRVRTTGQTVSSPQSLYLIEWRATAEFEHSKTRRLSTGQYATVYCEGEDAQIRVKQNVALRPCKAPLSEEECTMLNHTGLYEQSMGLVSYEGGEEGGSFYVSAPGVYDARTLLGAMGATPSSSSARAHNTAPHLIYVFAPSVSYACTFTCESAHEYYPYDTTSLLDGWWTSGGGGMCNATPSVSAGLEDSLVEKKLTQNEDHCRGEIVLDGEVVWSGEATHAHHHDCSHRPEAIPSSEGETDEACGTCENGSCDEGLEGPSLGSFRFRVPLGMPRKGEVSGFLYFETDSGVMMTPSLFEVMTSLNASVTDHTSGTRRTITCSDFRGREILIDPLVNGVRLTINQTQSHTLEHTWEIVNVNGATSVVRLVKKSRAHHVLEDWTYSYIGEGWESCNNVTGLMKSRTTTLDEMGRIERTVETTTDKSGALYACVTNETETFGTGAFAVSRTTFWSERTATSSRFRRLDYWNDACSKRTGKLRLVKGNDCPWRYYDYDAQGREVLRLEQRGLSPVPDAFPQVVGGSLVDVSQIEHAILTQFDYEPTPDETFCVESYEKPCCETKFLVLHGKLTQMSRTWWRYRKDGQHVKAEKWCASSQSATRSDPTNLYSYEKYAGASFLNPLVRNHILESLEENGLKKVLSVTLSGERIFWSTRAFFNGCECPTYETEEWDENFGNVLARATCLTGSNAHISEEHNLYDEKNRLRSTIYQDGTFETNAYSCCRLLWKQDRLGRKTFRSAQTGTDNLYYAEENVWLARLSTNGQFKVTQHFCDALGRETNRVVCASSTPGEAQHASCSEGKILSQEKTAYAGMGTSHAETIDTRGLVTITSEVRHPDRIVCANEVRGGDLWCRQINTSFYDGGYSSRKEWGDLWTEQITKCQYLPNGCRLEYRLTKTSDAGVVTNEVTTYDFLGRKKQIHFPQGAIHFRYNGGTLTNAQFESGTLQRTVEVLHDFEGSFCGYVLDGMTNRTDITFEHISNDWYRVQTKQRTSPSMQQETILKTQLTGLDHGLRAHTLVRAADGCATETFTTFDTNTQHEIERTFSSDGQTSCTVRLCASVVEKEEKGERTILTYDALGQQAQAFRTFNGSRVPVSQNIYFPAGDVIQKLIWTNETAFVSERFRYNPFGQQVSKINASGEETIFQFDACGNLRSQHGATYPVQYDYDSQNRLIRLRTTQDGVHEDETQWQYNFLMDACETKIYADGSSALTSWTSDGLPLRLTSPSGAWKENAYNDRRQCVTIQSSDGKQDAALTYDSLGRRNSESNQNLFVTSLLNVSGTATNETWHLDGTTMTLTRTLDACGRRIGFSCDALNDSLTYTYTTNGLLASISNADMCATYQWTQDERVAGIQLRFSNGQRVTRTMMRDAFCRDRVLRETFLTPQTQRTYAYSYDALGRLLTRNQDQFAYNERSEVTSVRVGTHHEDYAYDLIGNLVASHDKTYTVNALNQYQRLAASNRVTSFTYTPDGALASCGPWSFTYDSASRLETVSSNGSLLVTNFYDAQGRRVKKLTPTQTNTFIYDGWNLIYEHIARDEGTQDSYEYYWGNDLSGSLTGAGGVGGLLYMKKNGTIYVPLCDVFGNILGYVNQEGTSVQAFTYDAFGNVIASTGSQTSDFHFRFSSKYNDSETGLYYYGHRFYSSILRRWLTRDPIEENGDLNLYAFCINNAFSNIDPLGENRYMTTFQMKRNQLHVGVAVDNWRCEKGKWVKAGIITFDFSPDEDLISLSLIFVGWKRGVIDERIGMKLNNYHEISSTPREDLEMIQQIREQQELAPRYNFFFNNCIHWSLKAIDYGR